MTDRTAFFAGLVPLLEELGYEVKSLGEGRLISRPSFRSFLLGGRLQVETDAGTFQGDVMVVALGADLHPSATPGLVEAGHEFYTVAGAFATHEIGTNRNVFVAGVGGAYDAKFMAESLGVRAEAGYRVSWQQPFGITPYAALQSQWLRLPSYSETTTADPTFLLCDRFDRGA